MKKTLLLVGMLAVVGFVMGQYSNPAAYVTFRTVSATEDTQLTATTQRTAPDRSNANTIRILRTPVGAMHVRLKGTNAENDTMAWTIWAYKNASSPAKYVAHGTAILGATTTGTANEYYVDSITITDQQWFKTVSTAAGTPDTIVTGGGISELIFDTCEHTMFQIIIRDIAGGGIECETAGADYCTYY
jgi:hypothetical protein